MVDTPSSLARGLMFRKELPENEGMLFKFQDMNEAHFWGKNTYIPLDIAFIDRDHTITGIKEIAPMSTRMIHSDGLCSMAIEANAGFFKKNNVKPGHRIQVNGNTIEFESC